MASKVAHREEMVRETVPFIVQYSTRTEYEEATMEEIHLETSYEPVTEIITELESSTVQEEIPAIVTYSALTVSEDVPVTDTVAAGGKGDGGKGESFGGATQDVFETVLEVVTETFLEEVPKVVAYSIENHIDHQDVTSHIVTTTPVTITEVSHVVESDCGGKGGADSCKELVPASKTVQFNTVYETIVAVEKRVKHVNRHSEVTISGTPTFRVSYEEEQVPSVRLEVVQSPVTLTEMKLETKTEVVTVEVQAVEVYKTEILTEEGCPEGTSGDKNGCIRVSSAQKKSSCPHGSIHRNGGCYEKDTHTVTVCPPGAEEANGGCQQKEVIPATAVYGAGSSAASKGAPTATKDAPPAAKKDVPPAPTKRRSLWGF